MNSTENNRKKQLYYTFIFIDKNFQHTFPTILHSFINSHIEK